MIAAVVFIAPAMLMPSAAVAVFYICHAVATLRRRHNCHCSKRRAQVSNNKVSSLLGAPHWSYLGQMALSPTVSHAICRDESTLTHTLGALQRIQRLSLPLQLPVQLALPLRLQRCQPIVVPLFRTEVATGSLSSSQVTGVLMGLGCALRVVSLFRCSVVVPAVGLRRGVDWERG